MMSSKRSTYRLRSRYNEHLKHSIANKIGDGIWAIMRFRHIETVRDNLLRAVFDDLIHRKMPLDH